MKLILFKSKLSSGPVPGLRKPCIYLLLVLSLFSSVACQRAPFRKNNPDYSGEAADEGYYRSQGDSDSALARAELRGQLRKRMLVLDFLNDTPVKPDKEIENFSGSASASPSEDASPDSPESHDSSDGLGSMNSEGLAVGDSFSGGSNSSPTGNPLESLAENPEGASIENLGAFVSREFRRGLNLTRRVIVPADAQGEVRGDVQASLRTDEFLEGDRVKIGPLIQEGRLRGVSVLLIGRINRIVFRQKGKEVGLLGRKESSAAAALEVKLFDVTAGREILALTRVGEARDQALTVFEGNEVNTPEYRARLIQTALQNGVAALIPDLVRAIDKMKWQGKIAKITGAKVYVNAGRVSGLQPQDILKVLTAGEDIYDPQNGAYMGRSSGQEKGTLEVESYIGNDASKAHIHTGGNFQEGDIVQLY